MVSDCQVPVRMESRGGSAVRANTANKLVIVFIQMSYVGINGVSLSIATPTKMITMVTRFIVSWN